MPLQNQQQAEFRLIRGWLLFTKLQHPTQTKHCGSRFRRQNCCLGMQAKLSLCPPECRVMGQDSGIRHIILRLKIIHFFNKYFLSILRVCW